MKQLKKTTMTSGHKMELITPYYHRIPSLLQILCRTYVPGGLGEDHISLNLDMTSNNPTRFKYSEERILKELTDYISATYNQHYSAGDDKVQTLDLIEACGDGESFCRSNILKYASRYDKKGTARRDIMKILHYAVLLMHFNDKNAQRETYPQ